MCNLYTPPDLETSLQRWRLNFHQLGQEFGLVGPRQKGPFIRAKRNPAAEQHEREFLVGQWALIPFFAKQAKLPYSTNNARFEEITVKASFKGAWARGQRCIIPASSFLEPCWESGRNVWWKFTRADGDPWGLAGLWNTWTDRATGEVHESFTMLTQNADSHPLMSRMHKPDPNLPPHQQDKRSVVVIELEDVDTWLHAPVEEAAKLVRLSPVEIFNAEPQGLRR